MPEVEGDNTHPARFYTPSRPSPKPRRPILSHASTPDGGAAALRAERALIAGRALTDRPPRLSDAAAHPSSAGGQHLGILPRTTADPVDGLLTAPEPGRPGLSVPRRASLSRSSERRVAAADGWPGRGRSSAEHRHDARRAAIVGSSLLAIRVSRKNRLCRRRLPGPGQGLGSSGQGRAQLPLEPGRKPRIPPGEELLFSSAVQLGSRSIDPRRCQSPPTRHRHTSLLGPPSIPRAAGTRPPGRPALLDLSSARNHGGAAGRSQPARCMT